MSKRTRTQKTIKNKFTLADKIVLALNIIAALLLVLGYLSPIVDPRDSALVSVLGFAYLILLGANLLFVIYWIIRKPVFALISIVCIAAGYKFIIAQYGFNKQSTLTDKQDSSVIRAMQYNVRTMLGIGIHDGVSIKKEVAEVVADVQPDIVALEEFGKYRNERDSATLLIKQALKTKYSFFSPYKIYRGDTIGNAMFSKYPIIRTGLVDTSQILNTQALYMDLQVGGKIVRAYCIHLVAVQIKARSKRKLLKGSGGVLGSSMIYDKLAAAFITRSYQLDKIKRSVDACPYPYIILGDFNDTPMSYAVQELSKGMKNAFIEKGNGFQTTYYSGYPLQIDYVLTSDKWDILNYNAIDRELSDHKPVITDLKLR